MAIDPITAGLTTIGSIAVAIAAWMNIYGDPEKNRLRTIRKLNAKADKLRARIEELKDEKT